MYVILDLKHKQYWIKNQNYKQLLYSTKYTLDKMDNFFQDEFKVNMGNKKDLTKEQLLAQNRKER